jgi:hypothetical protein
MYKYVIKIRIDLKKRELRRDAHKQEECKWTFCCRVWRSEFAFHIQFLVLRKPLNLGASSGMSYF